jgi:hypothetical protein
MSSDLTFLTNEQGNALSDRFRVLLGDSTRFFDVLVGYFYVSGFQQLYPSPEKTEKMRKIGGQANSPRNIQFGLKYVF